jgi:hypothetical protein
MDDGQHLVAPFEDAAATPGASWSSRQQPLGFISIIELPSLPEHPRTGQTTDRRGHNTRESRIPRGGLRLPESRRAPMARFLLELLRVLPSICSMAPIPAVTQKRSKELFTSCQAVLRLGTSASDEGVVIVVMAAPRA